MVLLKLVPFICICEVTTSLGTLTIDEHISATTAAYVIPKIVGLSLPVASMLSLFNFSYTINRIPPCGHAAVALVTMPRERFLGLTFFCIHVLMVSSGCIVPIAMASPVAPDKNVCV
eukprot:NODE_435_length_8649_cov_0.394386.p8 type:complete len:117 gc:universal NODE_435_length_8649_cov_0.394386:7745-8095(+)